jgi:RNA polymerase sigma-70 factor (ECF subfamily)
VTLNSIYFNPEKLLITEEILRQIQQAVSNLPPRCRLIFKLVKEDGLKYKEVAGVLNISVFTVRNQLAIAVHKLAEALPAYAGPNTRLMNRVSTS